MAADVDEVFEGTDVCVFINVGTIVSVGTAVRLCRRVA